MPKILSVSANAFLPARLRLALASVAFCLSVGCGREAGSSASTEPTAPPAVSNANPSGDASAASASAGADSAQPAIAVTVDAAGRKWLTPTVPYDVFPGLPSEEAIAADVAPVPEVATEPAVVMQGNASRAEGGEVVASTDRRPSVTGPASEPLPVVVQATDGSTSVDDWEKILPREVLLAEVAAVRNEMGEGLLTVGSYNSAFEQIAIDGVVMSALATIASEHPADLSWKSNALLARDSAVAVANASTARGRQNFKDAEIGKDRLFAVLNNNPPPGMATPDVAASREETADRAALMTRMQRAYDRLKPLATDESMLKREAAAGSQEAHLLAALAKFTSHEDYGATEHADYQSLASSIIAGGLSMAKAVEAQDSATFRAEFERVGTACNQCHQKYRFEN